MGLEGAIITLVVFGSVFLITAMAYLGLFDSGKRAFSDKECEASLLLTRIADPAFGVACIKPIDNPTPIKCSRHFFTVTDDTVTDTTGKEAKDVTRSYACDPGTASCLAPRLVAQEMRRCWEVFGEGQVPVFQQVDRVFDFGNNERACFVCAEVTIRTSADVTAFKEYLRTTQVQSVVPSEDRTYYDVLAGNPKALCSAQLEKKGTCWEAMANIDDPKIDQDNLRTGQTYAITFIRRGMERDCDKDGLEDPALSVQAIPADDISKHCDVVLT